MRPISLPSRWVLPIALLIFMVLVFILEYQVLQYTKGVFVYPYDDAYLRMAIARNITSHKVWGLSGQEFVSASSSILYPILLAGFYKILGPKLIISFLINLVFAIILIVVIHRWLQQQSISPISQLMILTVAIVLTPLPILVAMGMEHVLQMLISFLFLYRFCEWIANLGSVGRQNPPLSIYVLAFLMTAIRYEGLFLLAPVVFFLLYRRKWLVAIGLVSLALLPVILFGLYSIRQGSYFVPNSLLTRSIPMPLNLNTVENFFSTALVNNLLYTLPYRGAQAVGRVMILLPLLFCLFIKQLRQSRLYRVILTCCIVSTTLHLIFVMGLFLYRHEAYLFVCLVPITGSLIVKYGKEIIPARGAGARLIALWTAIVLLTPLILRAWQAYKDTGVYCLNMYEQGHQIAAFLKQYYNGATVVMDGSLGAAAFWSDGKKLDIVDGITNIEVLRSKEEEYYRPTYQDFLSEKEKPKIAIINEKLYSPWLYAKWTKVATWRTYKFIGPKNADVSFYTIHQQDSASLKQNLDKFQNKLPPGVKVMY